MKYAYATSKGIKIQNEDSILIGSRVFNDELAESDEKVSIFGVADGVSSNKGGNVASRIILESLAKLNNSYIIKHIQYSSYLLVHPLFLSSYPKLLL